MNDEPPADGAEYEAPSIKKIDPDVAAAAEGDYILAQSSIPDLMAWLRQFDP